MIHRGQIAPLLRPGLRKDFRDSYNEYPVEYNMYLKEGTMDRAEIEAMTMSGLPRQPARGEVEPVTYFDPEFSPKTIYTDVEYASGMSVSRRSIEDDQYGKANQKAKYLGRSTRLTQEYEAAAFLEDAFTGAVFRGFNNEPLISATHSLLGASGTWTNLVAGNPPLGVTGMESALELSERLVDQDGNPIPMRVNKLIFKIRDWAKVTKLLGGEKEPFTANNQVNAIREKVGQGLTRVMPHYWSQTGRQWFLVDSTLSDAHFLFKLRPEFDDHDDFMTKAAFFDARQRFLIYFYDQRGWIGSNAT